MEHGNEVIQKNIFFYLWIISALVSTCYTFAWDIKMDWGLLDKNAGENKLLREEIVYAYKVDCTELLDARYGQKEIMHMTLLLSWKNPPPRPLSRQFPLQITVSTNQMLQV